MCCFLLYRPMSKSYSTHQLNLDMQQFQSFSDRVIRPNVHIVDTTLSFRDLIDHLCYLYTTAGQGGTLTIAVEPGKVPALKASSYWRPARDEKGKLALSDLKRAAHLAGFFDVASERQRDFVVLRLSREPVMPVVIGMPTYKTPHLASALNDIFNQSYSNWRLIISDDGDNKELVHQVCDSRGITVFHIDDLQDLQDDPTLLPPKTVVYSQNTKSQQTEHKAYHNFMRVWRLFQLASCGIVLFLHDDDRYPSNLLEAHVKKHLSFEDVVTVAVKRTLINQDGEILPEQEFNKPLLTESGIIDHQDMVRRLLWLGHNLVGENMAISHKAKAIRSVDDPFKARVEDIHLSLDLMQVLRVVGPVIWTNLTQIYYRQHEKQDSRQGPTQFHMEAIWLAAGLEYKDLITGLNLATIIERGEKLRGREDLNEQQRNFVHRSITELHKISGTHEPNLRFAPIFVDDMPGTSQAYHSQRGEILHVSGLIGR